MTFGFQEERHPETYKYHAKRRARERYGVNLSVEELVDIKNNIRKTKFVYKVKHSNRVIRRVFHAGKQMFFIWDKEMNEIITFLPADDSRCKG